MAEPSTPTSKLSDLQSKTGKLRLWFLSGAAVGVLSSGVHIESRGDAVPVYTLPMLMDAKSTVEQIVQSDKPFLSPSSMNPLEQIMHRECLDKTERAISKISDSSRSDDNQFGDAQNSVFGACMAGKLRQIDDVLHSYTVQTQLNAGMHTLAGIAGAAFCGAAGLATSMLRRRRNNQMSTPT